MMVLGGGQLLHFLVQRQLQEESDVESVTSACASASCILMCSLLMDHTQEFSVALTIMIASGRHVAACVQ